MTRDEIFSSYEKLLITLGFYKNHIVGEIKEYTLNGETLIPGDGVRLIHTHRYSGTHSVNYIIVLYKGEISELISILPTDKIEITYKL